MNKLSCYEHIHGRLPECPTSSKGDSRKLNSRKATSAGLSLVNPKLSYSPGAVRTAANSRKLHSIINWPMAKLMGVWPSFQWPSSAGVHKRQALSESTLGRRNVRGCSVQGPISPSVTVATMCPIHACFMPLCQEQHQDASLAVHMQSCCFSSRTDVLSHHVVAQRLCGGQLHVHPPMAAYHVPRPPQPPPLSTP